jgi:hypothetical protein
LKISMHPPLQTPVAFFIFNRPDLTARVFERIAQAQPKILFLIADGPRTPAEKKRCESARRVVERVDWECRVLRDYRDVNLGCARRIFSGLDWVFSQTEEAIILEDDCLPDLSFFFFCHEMLHRYREEPRIGHIGGNNYLEKTRPAGSGYYFSRYALSWGWATWRRAWNGYNLCLSDWPNLRESGWLDNHCDNPEQIAHWKKMFDSVCNPQPHTWDFQWQYHVWKQNALSIAPARNLVANLGCRPDATHTRKPMGRSRVPANAVWDWPPPPVIERDQAADLETFARAHNDRPLKTGWKTLASLFKPFRKKT